MKKSDSDDDIVSDVEFSGDSDLLYRFVYGVILLKTLIN